MDTGNHISKACKLTALLLRVVAVLLVPLQIRIKPDCFKLCLPVYISPLML